MASDKWKVADLRMLRASWPEHPRCTDPYWRRAFPRKDAAQVRAMAQFCGLREGDPCREQAEAAIDRWVLDFFRSMEAVGISATAAYSRYLALNREGKA